MGFLRDFEENDFFEDNIQNSRSANLEEIEKKKKIRKILEDTLERLRLRRELEDLDEDFE